MAPSESRASRARWRSMSSAAKGCAAGSKFCGNLTLAQSKTDLVFAAIGKDSNGNVAGNGCTRKSVNQEAVPVQITMVRFLPPAVCGDGMIEPGETCDPGTGSDPLCMACQTSERVVGSRRAMTRLRSA